MKSLSNRKARRKQQNQAKKKQRPITKKKVHHSLGKRLTSEQKKKRSEQLAKREESKQKRKQLSKEKNETEKIKNIQNAMSTIFNHEILDQLAKVTGFIKRSGEVTAFSFMYIVSFGFLGNGEIALTLSEDFKGQGGGASKSALKLDFIYDIANCLVYGMKITSSTINDQTQSKDILKYIKRGVLTIRDLGYFTITVLKGIQDKSAYYISRLSISTNVYLNQVDEEPLDVPKFLEQLHMEGKDSSNIKIYLGKIERFETRLVAEKVPEHVAKQRTARFKRDRKKDPSPYYVEWCGFSIFITNIPETMFTGKMIIFLYKIRWQIELLFKNFKSNVEINILKGTNKNRIESLIYGRLITIVVMFIIQNYAMNIIVDKEISGDKLTKLLKSDNQLRQAIIKNDMSMLLIVLECDIALVCKQKRSRKTSYEHLEEGLSRQKSGKCDIVALSIDLEYEIEENQFKDAI